MLATASNQQEDNPLGVAYRILSQVVGLYVQAAEYDYHKLQRQHWLDSSDSVLRDLGDVYEAWNALFQGLASPMPPDEEKVVRMRLDRLCQRVEKITRLLDAWTPILKWAELLLLCEQHWFRNLDYMRKSHMFLAGKLERVDRESAERLGNLTGIVEMYRKERGVMRSNFVASSGDEFI